MTLATFGSGRPTAGQLPKLGAAFGLRPLLRAGRSTRSLGGKL